MPLFKRTVRSALLIDFDNLLSIYKRPLLDNIDAWLTWLERGQFDPKGLRRRFIARRVYWNMDNNTHQQTFARRRFDVKLCRAIRKEKASSADFDITIDAIELSHKHRNLDEVIILSFDTDFSSVLLHLQLDGRSGVAMIDGDTLDNMRDTPTAKYMRILDHSIGKREFGAVFGVTFDDVRPATPANQQPAPQPRPVAPPAPKPPQPALQPAAAFDFKEAARRLSQSARDSGLVYLGKDRIRKLVESLPGFKNNSGRPWHGHSYEKFLAEIVAAALTQFEVGKDKNGGVLLIFRGAS